MFTFFLGALAFYGLVRLLTWKPDEWAKTPTVRAIDNKTTYSMSHGGRDYEVRPACNCNCQH